MRLYKTKNGQFVDLDNPYKDALGSAPVPTLNEQGVPSGRISFGGIDLNVPIQTPAVPSPGGMPAPEPVPAKPPSRVRLGKNGKIELAPTQPEPKLILGQNVEELEPDNQLILGQNVEEVLPQTPALPPTDVKTNPTAQLEQIYAAGRPNWASSLSGLGSVIAGRDPRAAMDAAFKRSDAALQEPVAMQKELTQEKSRVKSLEKAERDEAELAAKKAREQDPNSDESKVAQEIALEMGYTGDISMLTAERFRTFSPALNLRFEKAQRAAEKEAERLDKKEQAEEQRAFLATQNEANRENQRFIAGQNAAMAASARESAREDRQANRDEQRQVRQNDQTDKQVEKLSDRLEPYQATFGAVESVEQLLGAPLEAFDNKGGTLLKNGKSSDLPGVNVPGIGRVSFFSGDARQLTAAISGIFNRELKTRSGAAVTTQELERLKTEFNTGKFNTEAELIAGLKRYKAELRKAFNGIKAGAPQGAVREYEERGGQTTGPLPQSPGGQPSGNRSVANSADDL